MKSRPPKIAAIHITDLKISTIIGTNAWERTQRQPLVINIILDYEASGAIRTDDLTAAVDYKALKKEIIRFVQHSRYNLLETLTCALLELILNDKRILSAWVQVDKPRALRFAKSVSISMSASRAAPTRSASFKKNPYLN